MGIVAPRLLARSGDRSGSRPGRTSRTRTLTIGVCVFVAPLSLGAWAGARSRPAPPPDSVQSAPDWVRHHYERPGQREDMQPRIQVVHVGTGAALRRFDVREPEGLIRLLRVTVPHGMRVRINGVIPGLATIGISAPAPSAVASESCRQRGVVDVCTQAEEACPMPAATWGFRLQKLAGPAGLVRLEFAVGDPPSAQGG